VEFPEARSLLVETGKVTQFDGFTGEHIAFGRSGREDRIPAVLFSPKKPGDSTIVILAHSAGKSNYLDAAGAHMGLAKELVHRGFSVLLPDLFLTGELADPDLAKTRQYSEKFYLTYYNRTDVQERVQDLITACAFAKTYVKARHVIISGADRSGLPVLLAAPAADAIVADCAGLDSSSDEALMAQDLFLPGIRNLGGFEGAAILAAPNPLLLHNAQNQFSTDSLSAGYSGASVINHFRKESARLSDADLARKISELRL